MNVESILQSIGYIGIFISVFIECGFILGLVLPLPGFSLLFTAGVFAASDQMNIQGVIAVGVAAAIIGYISGYYTGLRYGRKLFFEKSTQKYFTEKQGELTEKFMKKYGYPTLIIGRYLPIMHSLAPILSGVAKTPFLPFMIVNIIGAILWTCTASLLGYYAGQNIPHAQYLAIPFVIVMIILTNGKRGRRIMRNVARWVESV